MRTGPVLALLLAGCLVESGKEVALVKGEGAIQVDSAQVVHLDSAQVPVLGACGAGQIVSKTAEGWACTTLPALFPPAAHTHPSTAITDFGAAVTTLIGGTQPAAHTHSSADVTDFGAAVDAAVLPGVALQNGARVQWPSAYVESDASTALRVSARGGVRTSSGFAVASPNRNLRIESGTISVAASTDYTVTFSRPFLAPPVVTLAGQYIDTAEACAVLTTGVGNPSATGFITRLIYCATSAWATGKIHWIAIGTDAGTDL